MDPRVKTSLADLQKQFDLSSQVYDDLQKLQAIAVKLPEIRTQLKSMREKADGIGCREAGAGQQRPG